MTIVSNLLLIISVIKLSTRYLLFLNLVPSFYSSFNQVFSSLHKNNMPNNHIKSLKLSVKEKEHLFNKFISLYNKGKHLDNNLFF